MMMMMWQLKRVATQRATYFEWLDRNAVAAVVIILIVRVQ